MGNTTKREYDRNGNLCAVTDAAGTRTLYAYDAMDRLIQSAWEEQTSVLMKGIMQGTSWPRQMPLDGALIMAMTF